MLKLLSKIGFTSSSSLVEDELLTNDPNIIFSLWFVKFSRAQQQLIREINKKEDASNWINATEKMLLNAKQAVYKKRDESKDRSVEFESLVTKHWNELYQVLINQIRNALTDENFNRIVAMSDLLRSDPGQYQKISFLQHPLFNNVLSNFSVSYSLVNRESLSQDKFRLPKTSQSSLDRNEFEEKSKEVLSLLQDGGLDSPKRLTPLQRVRLLENYKKVADDYLYAIVNNAERKLQNLTGTGSDEFNSCYESFSPVIKESIKYAYYQASLILHPDKCGSPDREVIDTANQLFKGLAETKNHVLKFWRNLKDYLKSAPADSSSKSFSQEELNRYVRELRKNNHRELAELLRKRALLEEEIQRLATRIQSTERALMDELQRSQALEARYQVATQQFVQAEKRIEALSLSPQLKKEERLSGNSHILFNEQTKNEMDIFSIDQDDTGSIEHDVNPAY